MCFAFKFSATLVAALGIVQPALAQIGAPAEWAPGRLIVAQRAGVTPAQLDAALRPFGGTARRLGASDLHVVRLPAGMPETTALKLLQRHPLLKFAELDYKVPKTLTSNDPDAYRQWHLPKTKATTAWDTVTGAGVTIAILDTGVAKSHPDLAANMVAGWNTFDNNSNADDVEGHGTTTAGTAAATLNNGIGVAGVAGGAKIMPIRVTDAAGNGYYSTIASGITYAADRGARIASASFGWLFKSSTIINAANYMKSKGGVVVVSAGNAGINENSAETTSMVVVSATDSADNMAGWSSFGNMVSVAAPGVDILTTTRDGGYASVNGTSYSAPATAGVLALIMSANPSLSAAQAQSVLLNSAVDLGAAGRDIYYGYGRVDAEAAVRMARGTTSADTQKPAVALVNPVNGSSVSGVVAVDVTASDNVGVTRVDLLVNGSVVASDTAAPYGFAWDSSTVSGSATLSAAAYDAAGNAAGSAPVAVSSGGGGSITADVTAPIITALTPANNTSVSGSVQIRATATDDSGAAALSQSLSINGVKVASATGGALSYTWNTRKAKLGGHSVTLNVTDKAGNLSSQTITLIRTK